MKLLELNEMTVVVIPMNLPNPIFQIGDKIVVDALPMGEAEPALNGKSGSVFGFGRSSHVVSVLLDGGGVRTLGAGNIKHTNPWLTARRLVSLFNRLRGHTTLVLTRDMRINRPDQLQEDSTLDPLIRKMVAESLAA